MRENKFRGWFQGLYEGEKWVYGYLSKNGENLEITDGQTYCTVDEDTVGEFIGKTDKNRVEIYEGDIVQRIYKYEIKRRENSNKLYAHILDGSKYHLKIGSIGRDFEVIGNIHKL